MKGLPTNMEETWYTSWNRQNVDTDKTKQKDIISCDKTWNFAQLPTPEKQGCIQIQKIKNIYFDRVHMQIQI